MPILYESLKQSALEWRQSGYACDGYPMIGEILAYQMERREDVPTPKFLREPQLLALEVYWYIRLKLQTPHIIDLYKHYYAKNKKDFSDALKIPLPRDVWEWATIDKVIEKIKTDLNWVKKERIQALHEATILPYPSYILALTMGAGKTALIGAIIATEFAMSLRYPQGNFMKNALVFAPGTTIIESLREISGLPYEKILPPNINRDFAANLKIEYTGRRKDIQAQQGSSYNLIVSNTEKISLRARRRSNQTETDYREKELQANSRLQKIASLPNLGVFSDEAHHTYGNTFDKLKRVRETINYIHEHTPIVAVVNTTGTPYYKKEHLKEVIVWYGLSDGIQDNILKELCNGVHQYDIKGQSEKIVFNDIIQVFFNKYGKVSLPNGAKAKMAFYFKTQEHLIQSRRLIEQAMTSIGESVDQILVNTQQSKAEEMDQFKRLNNPGHQKRIILLIGKGVEGWNCPSLFACALIKEQTKSNNYVLQAATRCLRQVQGNQRPAKIFLDRGNAKILDKELQENFGTDIIRLSAAWNPKETVTMRVVKAQLPKLEITRTVKRAVRTEPANQKIALNLPNPQQDLLILRSTLTPDFSGGTQILMPTGNIKELPATTETTSCYTAAHKIAAKYHLSAMLVLKQLNNLYPQTEMPINHLYSLFQQVEKQQANYKTVEEKITEAMALIRLQDETGKDVFEKDKDGVYVHRLRLLERTHQQMEESGMLVDNKQDKDNHNLSFHYTPYNFDSKPECDFFWQILFALNTDPDEVESFLFTGGLTDSRKTDFHFEYLGEDKRYHRYFPDFVIVKKTGEFYIVEVKAESERGDKTVETKKKAVERLQKMQPDKFKYNVVYTSTDTIEADKIKPIIDWIYSQ